MKNSKVVCFAGHRFSWRFVGIEQELKRIIEKLINEGYTTFLDGGIGDFDKLCAETVFELKKKYINVKIIKVLTYYKFKKEESNTFGYDDSVYPALENCHYKQKIIKKNQWIVDNSDVLVCCIRDKYKSGAYRTMKYTEKKKIKIIRL